VISSRSRIPTWDSSRHILQGMQVPDVRGPDQYLDTACARIADPDAEPGTKVSVKRDLAVDRVDGLLAVDHVFEVPHVLT
jgi:hypothetical protein